MPSALAPALTLGAFGVFGAADATLFVAAETLASALTLGAADTFDTLGLASLIPIIVFLAIAIAMSVIIRRRTTAQRKSGDFVSEYYIGNRSLGGFVLAMTTVATYGSVSSFVGGPGQAWSIGWGWVYMAVVQVTALFLLYGILGRKLALVGRRVGAVTIIDIIRRRYHSDILANLSALIIVVFFATTMIAQFVGGAKLFESVTGYSYTVGLVVFGLAVIFFTTIGGFRGVAWTDALCGIAMLLGLVVLAGGIIVAGGGWDALMTTIESNHPEMLEPFSGGAMPWTLYFTQWLLVGIFTFCLPQSAVRCIGAKDTRSISRAMIIGTVVIGFMMIVATSLGVLSAGVLTGDLASYGTVDDIIPAAITQCLPPWLAGVAIVGPIAASISTVSSLLIASSSAIVKDVWLARRERKEAHSAGAAGSERDDAASAERSCVMGGKRGDAARAELACAASAERAESAGAAVSAGAAGIERGGEQIVENATGPTGDAARRERTVIVGGQAVTLGIGAIVFALSIVPPDVIWKINMFAFGGLETAFAWVLVMGLFWRRATAAGAIASMAGGVAAYCVCMALGITVFGMHQIVIGISVALVLMVTVSLLTKPADEKTLHDFFPPKP